MLLSSEDLVTMLFSQDGNVAKAFHDKEFKGREPIKAKVYSCRECDLPAEADTNCVFVCPDKRTIYVGQGNGSPVKEIVPSNAKLFTESGEIDLSVYIKKSETMNTGEINDAIKKAIDSLSLPTSSDIVTNEDLKKMLENKVDKSDAVSYDDMDDSIKYHVEKILNNLDKDNTIENILEEKIKKIEEEIKANQKDILEEAIKDVESKVEQHQQDIYEDEFVIPTGTICHEFPLTFTPIGKIKFYLNGVRYFGNSFVYNKSTNVVKWMYTSSNKGLDITKGKVVIEYNYKKGAAT